MASASDTLTITSTTKPSKHVKYISIIMHRPCQFCEVMTNRYNIGISFRIIIFGGRRAKGIAYVTSTLSQFA